MAHRRIVTFSIIAPYKYSNLLTYLLTSCTEPWPMTLINLQGHFSYLDLKISVAYAFPVSGRNSSASNQGGHCQWPLVTFRGHFNYNRFHCLYLKNTAHITYGARPVSDFLVGVAGLTSGTTFLPRDAMHKRGLCRYAMSVCVSVCLCLSVMFVSSVKKNKHIIQMFSPSGSHVILVFPR